MVLITLKKAEESLFLFEAPATSPLSELVPQLAKLQNYRLRLRRLIDAAEDLIEYGPLKPDDQHGYDEDQLEALSKEKPATPPLKQEVERDGRKVLLNPDPTGRRTGEAPTEDMAEIIQKTLTNAKACLSQDLVKSNKCLTFPDLDEAFSNIRGAVAIVWPMGLPEWEPVREILEDKEDLTGTAASKEVIDIDTASLWWAGKELQREKKLVDYVGKNDKTKIIVKIQKKGQGPPLREAPLSEQQQKDMMAYYYYRKQEEHKKLAENDEDDYVNSAWANTKALKSAFSGVGNVSWRPT